MLLAASFFITENECCTNNENTRANFAVGSCYGTCVCFNDGDCIEDCNCLDGEECDSSHRGDIVQLILIVLIFVFFIILLVLQACGKHISKIIAIASLFLINAALVALPLFTETDIYCILIAGFSSFAVVCDLFCILLPNIGCCLNYYMIIVIL